MKEYTICKASAEQRKGRAGRTGPGVCFRIYSERVYDEMPDFPVPEIHKAPLESLALSIKNMKLGDPRRFPFVDPPPLHRMDAAMLRLRFDATQLPKPFQLHTGRDWSVSSDWYRWTVNP